MKNVLTKHFENLVDRLVETGRFASKSEVIHAGLRLLEEHELKVEKGSRADLEQILDEDLADPHPTIPAEQLYTRRQH
jgi:antitoxin ParD1/3/4